ncbi:MAG: hypothetical protein J0M34_02380 [Alphaproteobacteria bacterium]|nr:hypothetical protein [Alphaproteobacteria bacterium]
MSSPVRRCEKIGIVPLVLLFIAAGVFRDFVGMLGITSWSMALKPSLSGDLFPSNFTFWDRSIISLTRVIIGFFLYFSLLYWFYCLLILRSIARINHAFLSKAVITAISLSILNSILVWASFIVIREHQKSMTGGSTLFYIVDVLCLLSAACGIYLITTVMRRRLPLTTKEL